MKLEGPVVVTGASGFIGGELAEQLLRENTDVYCLVRPRGVAAARQRGFSEDRILPMNEFRHTDIAPLMKRLQPKFVFHLAASGVDPQSASDEEILRTNVDLVTQLLLSLQECSVVRFIHTGSCFEYAMSSATERLTEESLVSPESIYGAAKAASVLCGNALAKQLQIPFTTLRLFGVYGPGEAPKRLLPYLIDHLIHDRSVDLTAGEQVRDLLFVSDVVQAYVSAALSADLKTYEAYNVCSSQGTRIRELALAVAQVLGKPQDLLAFGERPYRAEECMHILGDNSRFQSHTDWAPQTSLEHGIGYTIEAAMAGNEVSNGSIK
jgi:UDP-glucose 4-epimerase